MLSGDTDLSGNVDITDLGNLLANYGATSGKTWLQGDTDANGSVDMTDLGNLLANYGSTPGASNAGFVVAEAGLTLGTSVPEPSPPHPSRYQCPWAAELDMATAKIGVKPNARFATC